MRKSNINKIPRDLWRAIIGAGVSAIALIGSTPLARLCDEPIIALLGMAISVAFLVAVLAHFVMRIFYPYMNGYRLYQQATGEIEATPSVAISASIALLSRSLVTLGIILLFGMICTMAKANGLSKNAVTYLPVLKSAINETWPDMPNPHYLAGLIELETGGKWSPKTETPLSVRQFERGVGFGQATMTPKMDSLTDLSRRHPELSGWNWGATLYDPRYQMLGVVLMNRDNYKRITNTRTEYDHAAMMLAAYNGGLGGLIVDRKICHAIEWCDPSRWIGNVALTSKKSSRARPGYKFSAVEINRQYPFQIMEVRSEKYKKWFQINDRKINGMA